MYASRPISSAELRPRRRWLLVAAAILVAGIIATILIVVDLFTGTAPKRTFAAGETVTINLTRSPRPGFYVSGEQALIDQCYARQPVSGQRYPAKPITGTMSITVNGEKWNVLSRLDLPMDDTYQVTCDANDANAGARYGIGYPPEAVRFVGGILATVLIPLISISAALVITLVVILRRNSHRRRLRATPPPPPYH
jgi:hypothetical protein